MTYIGGDTADDDLLLTSGLNGSTEVGTVPGVDLTLPADKSDVGVHVSNLGEDRTVGALNGRGNKSFGSCSTRKTTGRKSTLIRAGGDDNREVIGLAQASVEDNVVVHLLEVVVTDNAQEADLVVDDEQSGVVPVDPLKLVCSNWVDKRLVSQNPRGVKTLKAVNQPCNTAKSKVVKRIRNILFLREWVKEASESTERARETRKADGNPELKTVQLLYHSVERARVRAIGVKGFSERNQD